MGCIVRISCIGAGSAGLYFSILAKLRNPEHEITVYERRAAGSSYGWGVSFGPDLVQKLYANDPESAREIEDSTLRWRTQSVDIHGKNVSYAGSVDVYNINRPRLVEILGVRAQQLGVKICYGEEITSPTQVPDSDLIVAADGLNSRIREAVGKFGTVRVPTTDRYIWLGTQQPAAAPAYHYIRTDCGWIWGCIYGVPAGLSTFVVHCTQETWIALGFDTKSIVESIPLISEIFKEQLNGHRLIGQVGDETNARWLSFQSVHNQRWHEGNIALIGDCAHGTHFTAGLGTTLAVEDAMALVASLDRYENLESALQAYGAERSAQVSPFQEQARRSGQWFVDVSRYIDLEPNQFTTLLHARRSSLLPHLPPRVYYVIRQIRQNRQIHQISRKVVPVVKAIYTDAR
jgi:2-polyprenyl-6-methoxyphenol hydroxylase-like FAD-dependent oxidoreductase